ncbi:hypothetical protein V6N13_050033 [Hibiscus sabdariffa]|uniref:DUF3700 domain-containing protein n=1 Tax=Hibiscus sabdariffa TaxID=183260 RepID=A0ABR2QVG8_9ROSI
MSRASVSLIGPSSSHLGYRCRWPYGEIVKKGCGKPSAPFPKGCFFTSSGGLHSFEYPQNELKAMPRVDVRDMPVVLHFVWIKRRGRNQPE